MGIFDALSGSAYETANKRNLAAIGAGQQTGGNALINTSQNALDYLLGQNGVGGAFQYAGQGYDQAKTDLGNQYGQTQGYLGQATNAYQPLVSAGQNALGTYYDAIGANGADGSQRAASAFQAAPGYQYALDQALGSVQRTAAARGGLAGGNATADILKTATGLADQGYQQYVDNLRGGVGTYASGVQGMASGLTNQGNASQGYGSGLAGLDTGQGNARASILGQGAGVQQNLGNGFVNLANNSTNAITSANNQNAAGQTAASANALGAIVGLGTSGLGYLGQNGGITGALGKIAGVNPFAGL